MSFALLDHRCLSSITAKEPTTILVRIQHFYFFLLSLLAFLCFFSFFFDIYSRAPLPFNPSTGLYRYTFKRTASKVSLYANGVLMLSSSAATLAQQPGISFSSSFTLLFLFFYSFILLCYILYVLKFMIFQFHLILMKGDIELILQADSAIAVQTTTTRVSSFKYYPGIYSSFREGREGGDEEMRR